MLGGKLMIFNTKDLDPFDLNNMLSQLGKDQGYTPEEWDEVLHDYCTSLICNGSFSKG